jgi:serine acetyltransferase
MVFVHIVKAFGCNVSARIASIGRALKLPQLIGIVIMTAGAVIGDKVMVQNGAKGQISNSPR